MKYKVVPEPRSLAFVEEAHRALPLVPGTENDCCARLLDRTDLAAREDAREWVTFLHALDIADRTESGFRRLRGEVDRAGLGCAFRERVFGADAVLDTLSTHGPLGVDGVFERVRGAVPTWERHRQTDWETAWRERVRRLLGWAVVLGLAEHTGDAFRVAPLLSS